MENRDPDQETYRQAKKRVKKKIEFYNHLAVYLTANAIFFIVNMITSPQELWFLYPLFGWGICISFHFLSVFSLGIFKTDKMIENELRKHVNNP